MPPYVFLDSGKVLEHVLQYYDRDLTIMIPCYNEESNIIDTLNILVSVLRQMSFSWEIIAVDDASEDNTKELIQGYINEHPDYGIRLLVRKENAGLSRNYIDGAFLAKGRYYKLVCGDNAEPKESLEKIFGLLGKADCIIPHHIKVTGKSFFRNMLSKVYTFLVNLIGGYRIKYYNGCALCLTYNVMRWHTGYSGFCFQADIIVRSLDEGMSYLEIPVMAQERKFGSSQAIKLKNFFSVGHFFIDLIIRRAAKIYSAYEKGVQKSHSKK